MNRLRSLLWIVRRELPKLSFEVFGLLFAWLVLWAFLIWLVLGPPLFRLCG